MRRDIDTVVGKLAVFDEGSGPATFFWPSLYLDHASFDDVVANLAQERRCIVVDGPGHGESPGPGHAYDLGACARAAVQVLDALGIQAVDWVGNAWGGHVGVVAATSFPDRVKSLAAFGAPMHPLSPKVRWQKRLLLAMLRVGLTGPVGGLLAKVMLSPSAAAQHHAHVRDSVRRAARAGLAEAVRSISLGRPDLVPELARIRCPVLFVAGKDDAMWSPELAAAQARPIPLARCETLAGAAHLGPLERPTEATALLRGHWAAASARAPIPTCAGPASSCSAG
jgi:pimeloyl-ACP methyl ester carboxylesterase